MSAWIQCFRDLGVAEEFLVTHDSPCPKCGGKDRYHFVSGTGDIFCRQCNKRPVAERNGYHGLAWALSISAKEATGLIGEWEAKNGIRLPKAASDTEDKLDEVNGVINSSVPLCEAEAGLAYLVGRGLNVELTPDLNGVLRYLQAGLSGTEFNVQIWSASEDTFLIEKRVCDSVAVVYTDTHGHPQAVQRIAIQDGAKALGDQSKRFTGSFTGSSAVLGPDTSTVVICEGFETGLAIYQALRTNGVSHQVRIAGNDSNMSSVPLPGMCEEVILAADLDPSGNGEEQAVKAAETIRKTRRKVRIALPRPAKAKDEQSEERPSYLNFEMALDALFAGSKNKGDRADRFLKDREIHQLIGQLDSLGQLTSLTKVKNETGLGVRDLKSLIQRTKPEPEKVKLDWLDVLNMEHGAAKVHHGITNASAYRPTFIIDTDIASSAGQLIEHLGCHSNLYQRGSLLVEVAEVTHVIEKKPTKVTEIRTIDKAVFNSKTTEIVGWHRVCEDGTRRPAYPDDHATLAVFGANTYPESLIRPITGIIRTPVPISDGRIITRPGFDERSGLYYSPADTNYLGIIIPSRPNLDDAIKAKDLLFELVDQFPFRSRADRAAWIAEALTIVNQFRVPQNPLYLCEANLKGTGKGKLIDVLIWIAMGVLPEKCGMSSDDEEMAKKLLSVLISGQRSFYLDNVSGLLGGDTLDRALTSPTFNGRILGQSKMFCGSVDCLFMASGNNCELSGDLDRRLLLTRLETNDPHHSERQYKIPNLKRYLIDQRKRAQYHEALLTIARSFDVAGRPTVSLPEFGSFEDWSSLNRQAVVWLGEPDPLEPARDRKSLTAMRDAPMLDLIRRIWGWYGEKPFELSQLIDRLNPVSRIFKGNSTGEKYDPTLSSLLKSICGKEPDTKVLSNKLRRFLNTPEILDGIGTVAIQYNPRENGHVSGCWSLKLLRVQEIKGHGEDSDAHAPSTMPGVSSSEKGVCDSSGRGRVDISTQKEAGEKNNAIPAELIPNGGGAVAKIDVPTLSANSNSFADNEIGGAWTDSHSCPVTFPSQTSSLNREWMSDSKIELVASLDQLREFVDAIDGVVAWDVETTGLDTRSVDNIVGHALAVGKHAIYVPVRHVDYSGNLDPDVVLGTIVSCFGRPNVSILCWNHQFEFNLLRSAGIELSTEGGAKVLDVMALRYVTHNDGSQLGLKETAKNYLGLDAPTFEDALATIKVKRKGSKSKLHFGMTDPSITFTYGCSDVLLTLLAHEAFIGDAHEPEILTVEHEILDLLPLDPFLVDREYVRNQVLDINPMIEQAKQTAIDIAGVEGFNPKSSLQVGKWLVERGAGLPRTTSDQPSTTSDALEKLPSNPQYTPMVETVLKIRKLIKLKSTYLNNLLSGTDQDGYGRFKYSGLHTGTGRFSSSNGKKPNPAFLRMNGQNLPSKGPINIRRAIIARPGHWLAAIDLSQIELRIAAHLSEEPAWLEAFTTGVDPHESMMKLLGVERKVAKTANFNLLYGGSHHVLVKKAHITEEEARMVAQNWRSAVPTYMQWYIDRKKEMDQILEHEGYAVITTMFGRTRDVSSMYWHRDQLDHWLPGGVFNREWGSRDRAIERVVANTIIQGAAADINKRGLINVREFIDAECLPVKMLLTTHDELVFEIPQSSESLEICRQIALRYTGRIGKYHGSLGDIAIDCDLKIGATYGDLEEVKEFSLDSLPISGI